MSNSFPNFFIYLPFHWIHIQLYWPIYLYTKSDKSNALYFSVNSPEMPQAATSAGISEGGIVGVIIALLIIILIVIDLGCYVKLNKGVTKFLLENACKRGAAGKDKSTDVEAGAR